MGKGSKVQAKPRGGLGPPSTETPTRASKRPFRPADGRAILQRRLLRGLAGLGLGFRVEGIIIGSRRHGRIGITCVLWLAEFISYKYSYEVPLAAK